MKTLYSPTSGITFNLSVFEFRLEQNTCPPSPLCSDKEAHCRAWHPRSTQLHPDAARSVHKETSLTWYKPFSRASSCHTPTPTNSPACWVSHPHPWLLSGTTTSAHKPLSPFCTLWGRCEHAPPVPLTGQMLSAEHSQPPRRWLLNMC